MFSKPNVVDSGRRDRASWAPAIILFVGILSLLLLVTTNWIRERLVVVEMVRLNTLVELQLAVSTVHLWLEEHVSGDEVDLAEISNGLERAELLCSTLIYGGRVVEPKIEITPLQNGAALHSAFQVRGHLETFSDLTNSRLAAIEQHDNAGIGSPMDKEYDASYQSFLVAARNVERVTRNTLIERTRMARMLYIAILVSWTAVILLAVTGLRVREHKQRIAEEELRRNEAQLAQAQKMDAVGRLAGGITHDINNYVAAINTNCELLKMSSGSDSAVIKKMDTVLAVTGKISTLIERLLAFSARQPRSRESVNLNMLMTDFLNTLQMLVGKDIQVALDAQDEVWPIWIDPVQIEQIVMNLTVNSWQAMPAGGKILIAIKNITVDDSYAPDTGNLNPGDYVVLVVSDNGPGLSEEIQDNVFEPFFTTKDSSGNSGLGLATVYGIVQQNNGHISLFSEPGQGATFRIYLPRHKEKAESHPVEKQPSAGRQARGKTILLADDDDNFRNSIAELIRKMGYAVIADKDAESAIQTFMDRSSDIDLLITDVVMPGVTGPELARRVRSFNANIPVVFISGHTTETLLDRGLIDHPISILFKPFSTEELSVRITEALSRGSSS